MAGREYLRCVLFVTVMFALFKTSNGCDGNTAALIRWLHRESDAIMDGYAE